MPPEELEPRLVAHGLELQAAGRWPEVDAATRQRWVALLPHALPAAPADPSWPSTTGTTHFTRYYVARQAPHGDSEWLSAGRGPQPNPCQFIFLRGVSWRSADLDALRVWQGLMRALPSPFLPHLTSPPGLLVAHR